MAQEGQLATNRRRLVSAVATALLMAAAAVAPAGAAASAATVTRATLPSFFVDREGTFFAATCDVTQVINDGRRIETFSCTFDDAVPADYVCDRSCTWSSDFDGAPAARTHFLITQTGVMRGWALY